MNTPGSVTRYYFFLVAAILFFAAVWAAAR